jgi:DNA repair protein RecO (recombination protein O)
VTVTFEGSRAVVSRPGEGPRRWHDGSVAVYRDAAVVLRVTKLGEADRIVTLLARRTGRIRAVAKGVRRTKSRFGARLEPFSHVDLQLYQGRTLDIVTQAVTLDPFGAAIADDYSRYTAATAIVETAERLASEERQPWLRLYLLVVSALRALAEPVSGVEGDVADAAGLVEPALEGALRRREAGLVLDAFLLRAMALAGWAPALRDCARCSRPGPHAAFHVPSGGVLCPDCRGAGYARPAPATIELMAALSGGDWTSAESTAPEHRREASGLVAALLQFHLERGLRSLPLVDRTGSAPVPAWPDAGAMAAETADAVGTLGPDPVGADGSDAVGGIDSDRDRTDASHPDRTDGSDPVGPRRSATAGRVSW